MAKKVSQTNGGPGGRAFDDSWVLKSGTDTAITAITVRFDRHVHGLSVQYGDLVETTHGHGCASAATLRLRAGEYVTRVDGRAGSIIDSLTFVTSEGRTLGPLGGPGGRPFSVDLGGKALGFVVGRAGGSVDALAFGSVPPPKGSAPGPSKASVTPPRGSSVMGARVAGTPAKTPVSKATPSKITQSKVPPVKVFQSKVTPSKVYPPNATPSRVTPARVTPAPSTTSKHAPSMDATQDGVANDVRKITVRHSDVVHSVKTGTGPGLAAQAGKQRSVFIVPRGDQLARMAGYIDGHAVAKAWFTTANGVRSPSFGQGGGGRAKGKGDGQRMFDVAIGSEDMTLMEGLGVFGAVRRIASRG